MDEELKNRFILQKLEDLLSDNINLLPTIICEMERPEIVELIRMYCLCEGAMIPFRVKNHLAITSERLDNQSDTINWGELYILVNIN